jgi:hypothetical protein
MVAVRIILDSKQQWVHSPFVAPLRDVLRYPPDWCQPDGGSTPPPVGGTSPEPVSTGKPCEFGGTPPVAGWRQGTLHATPDMPIPNRH